MHLPLVLALLSACGTTAPAGSPAPGPTPPLPTPAAPVEPVATPDDGDMGLPIGDAYLEAEGADRALAASAGPGFGLYVLALTWEPSFCCQSPKKGQCAGLTGSPPQFGADHLTIHGLWPNYTDAEASAHRGKAYPAFCGKYSACNVGRGKEEPAWCSPDPSTIPADMAKYGPGYVTDGNFLADHEWPKHGSCTGLDSATYFSAAITALTSLPGDQGTPEIVTKNIGKSVARTDLAAAFGQADAVMLSCDASCQLQQVEVCYALDASGHPTVPTTCPAGAAKTPYNNSCALNHCDQVRLQVAGQCSVGSGTGGGGTPGGGTPPVTPTPVGGHCSADRGQGPECTDDATCASAGFLRCAKSGCCTNQK